MTVIPVVIGTLAAICILAFGVGILLGSYVFLPRLALLAVGAGFGMLAIYGGAGDLLRSVEGLAGLLFIMTAAMWSNFKRPERPENQERKKRQ